MELSQTAIRLSQWICEDRGIEYITPLSVCQLELEQKIEDKKGREGIQASLPLNFVLIYPRNI